MLKQLRILAAAVLLAFGTAAFASSPRQAKPVISILGDSYSTFENYIPEGNEIWYFQKCDTTRTDVDNVRQTWWWQLINEGGYILGKNDSYSGATISYSGYRKQDYKDRSFITRVGNLGSPDIILIFGATNDFWAKAPVGEHEFGTPTEQQLYSFKPAMSHLLNLAQQHYPGTDIYFVVNDLFSPEFNQAIFDICDHYGVKYILLHDIDKKRSHPNRAGMIKIKDQILEFLNNQPK